MPPLAGMTGRAGMDSRELYPSDEQRRRIMDFIMAAGETLLENGAEVFLSLIHI